MQRFSAARVALVLVLVPSGCGSTSRITATPSVPLAERSFTPDEVEGVLRVAGLRLRETVVQGLAVFTGRKGDAYVRVHVFYGSSGMGRAKREAAAVVPSALRHGWPAGRVGNVVYDVTPAGATRPWTVPPPVLRAITELRRVS